MDFRILRVFLLDFCLQDVDTTKPDKLLFYIFNKRSNKILKNASFA